ncbi:hypothetical protein IJ182_10580 [bacterium]|nr:hypothetical protein [bacterium]
MKISSKIPPINTSVKPNFKGEIIKFPSVSDDIKDIPSIVNPEYYQSIAGVKKPVYKTVVVKLKNGKEIRLEITKETTNKYLSDKYGKPDNNLINKFISLYTKNIRRYEEERQQEVLQYSLALEEQPENITEYNSASESVSTAVMDELSSTDWMSEAEFAQNILSKLSGKPKRELAKELLKATEIEEEIFPQKAYARTEQLFQLSKTPNGYDFSCMDKKNKLLDSLDLVVSQYPDAEMENVRQDFIRECTDTDGNFNFELAENSLKIMRGLAFCYPVKYIIGVANRFCVSDREENAQILNIMKQLNYSNFSMDDTRSDFEKLMELCFDNNGKFDKERSDDVLLAVEIADEWIGEQMELNGYDDNRYQNCHDFCLTAILDYYAEQQTPSENSSQQQVSFQEYIDRCSENLFFI